MTTLKKNYIFVIILAVLSISLIVFIVFPLFEEIKKGSQEILLEKKKIISLEKEKESSKKLEETYNTYQADFNKIENLFIDPDTPIGFINFLEEISKNSQVQLEISSMKLYQKTKEDLWPSLFFQVSVSGSFPNFLKFLEKLENGPYLVEFLDLYIKKADDVSINTISIKVAASE